MRPLVSMFIAVILLYSTMSMALNQCVEPGKLPFENPLNKRSFIKQASPVESFLMPIRIHFQVHPIKKAFSQSCTSFLIHSNKGIQAVSQYLSLSAGLARLIPNSIISRITVLRI